MKKTAALLTTAIMIILCAFSISFTMAYFSDRDTADGTSVSAGYLDISVDLELVGYGVPGDTLLNYIGSTYSPVKSTVTVTNNGTINADYTLSLTVDEATAYLLQSGGLKLYDTENAPLSPHLIDTDSFGAVTYVFKKMNAPAYGKADVYSLELMFKGTDLTDGNDYQNCLISVIPSVTAIQTGGVKQ